MRPSQSLRTRRGSPEAGNLGGGGYMVVRMSDGRSMAFDYRETAPAAAKPGMYKNPIESRVGYKASAVPGTVAGFALAHKTYGTFPGKAVLEPARGSPQRISRLPATGTHSRAPGSGDEAVPGNCQDIPPRIGQPLEAGQIVKQPDLAATIKRLQKSSRDFYEGETARLIAAAMTVTGNDHLGRPPRNYEAKPFHRSRYLP